MHVIFITEFVLIFFNQVLEKKDAAGENMSVDHLSEVFILTMNHLQMYFLNTSFHSVHLYLVLLMQTALAHRYALLAAQGIDL